jgi:hypothetical protein
MLHSVITSKPRCSRHPPVASVASGETESPASGTFRASSILSGVCAGQVRFGDVLVVLPNRRLSVWGVAGEVEQVGQVLLDRVVSVSMPGHGAAPGRALSSWSLWAGVSFRWITMDVWMPPHRRCTRATATRWRSSVTVWLYHRFPQQSEQHGP